jgi:hypothetical protein
VGVSLVLAASIPRWAMHAMPLAKTIRKVFPIVDRSTRVSPLIEPSCGRGIGVKDEHAAFAVGVPTSGDASNFSQACSVTRSLMAWTCEK